MGHYYCRGVSHNVILTDEELTLILTALYEQGLKQPYDGQLHQLVLRLEEEEAAHASY